MFFDRLNDVKYRIMQLRRCLSTFNRMGWK